MESFSLTEKGARLIGWRAGGTDEKAATGSEQDRPGSDDAFEDLLGLVALWEERHPSLKVEFAIRRASGSEEDASFPS